MRLDDSGSGWSDAGEPPDDPGEPADDAHPFVVAERARYERLDVVGAGGMGTIHVALDRRLGREVALKVVSRAADDAIAARRLAREATITARLEHPGIVPVHDAGEGADGRLFYTMRLVRGRSLADAIAGAGSLDARLALLRPYLAACQAVAYAHAQGVVHNDLKPANIMVGDYGECLVVDWGLAGDAGEPSAGGTPGYLSPERAAGGAASPGGDVYALGVVLADLLGDASAPAPAPPPELVAIAAKARAPAAADRFADAGALVADVAAYLDGRRVAAHQYAPLELLARLVRAWRAPLIAGAIGLVIAAIVFGVTWRRVLGERRRALAAEATARAHLRDALENHALAALDTGDRADAELPAAAALAIAEAPDARGVIVAAYAGARPTASAWAELPGCPQLLATRDDRAVCADGDQLSLRRLGAPEPTWTITYAAAEAALLDDGRVAVLGATRGAAVLDGATGAVLRDAPLIVPAEGLHVARDHRWVGGATAAHDVVTIDLADLDVATTGRVCAPAHLSTFALSTRAIVMACSDARLLIRSLDDAAADRWLALPETRDVISIAIHADDRHAALGGTDGRVVQVDLATGATAPAIAVARGAADRIAFLGDRLLVPLDRGGAAVWDLDAGVELLRLPLRDHHRYVAAGAELIGLGRGQSRWTLPAAPAPWRFDAPEGLSGAAVSPDGALLAVARGDGHVSVWRRADGRRVADLALSASVVKRVAFSPDGTRLAAVIAGPEALRVHDTRTWQPIAYEPTIGSKRVFFLASGELVAIPYDDGLDLWTLDGVRRHVAEPRVRDAYVAPGGDVVWLLTGDDRILRWRERGAEVVVADASGAHSLAASAAGEVIAAAHRDGVRVHAGAESRWLATTTGEITDVLVTADGRWIAAGTQTGATQIWRAHDGALVAILRGHHERTGAAALAPDGALITTSWDGAALTWDLSQLERPAAELVAAAEAAWGAGVVAGD